MELAVLLAAGLRDWIDFGVIIGILMLNATVGWYQEKQAADVVASLKGDIAMRSIVVRDGQEQEIKARELVPGDIVSSPSRRVNRVATPPGYVGTVQLTSLRSLLRTAKSSQLMPASSVATTTPMVMRTTSGNCRRSSTTPPKSMTRTTTVTRSTALDTPFWPLINLL